MREIYGVYYSDRERYLATKIRLWEDEIIRHNNERFTDMARQKIRELGKEFDKLNIENAKRF